MSELTDEIFAYCVEEDTKLRNYLKKLKGRLIKKNNLESAKICDDIISSLDYHIRKNKGENMDKSIIEDVKETLF